jgi:hypothetical protein
MVYINIDKKRLKRLKDKIVMESFYYLCVNRFSPLILYNYTVLRHWRLASLAFILGTFHIQVYEKNSYIFVLYLFACDLDTF